MGSKTNIWGTKVVSIASTVSFFCDASDEGREILATGQAAAVEYVEKQFEGPAMSDDEWASL